jgi:hypothetical protein
LPESAASRVRAGVHAFAMPLRRLRRGKGGWMCRKCELGPFDSIPAQPRSL